MTTGISMRSDAIDASRDLSAARSGEPGAYERTGSFTGGGTRRLPLKPVSSPMLGIGWLVAFAGDGVSEAVPRCAARGGFTVGADMGSRGRGCKDRGPTC